MSATPNRPTKTKNGITIKLTGKSIGVIIGIVMFMGTVVGTWYQNKIEFYNALYEQDKNHAAAMTKFNNGLNKKFDKINEKLNDIDTKTVVLEWRASNELVRLDGKIDHKVEILKIILSEVKPHAVEIIREVEEEEKVKKKKPKTLPLPEVKGGKKVDLKQPFLIEQQTPYRFED